MLFDNIFLFINAFSPEIIIKAVPTAGIKA